MNIFDGVSYGSLQSHIGGGGVRCSLQPSAFFPKLAIDGNLLSVARPVANGQDFSRKRKGRKVGFRAVLAMGLNRVDGCLGSRSIAFCGHHQPNVARDTSSLMEALPTHQSPAANRYAAKWRRPFTPQPVQPLRAAEWHDDFLFGNAQASGVNFLHPRSRARASAQRDSRKSWDSLGALSMPLGHRHGLSAPAPVHTLWHCEYRESIEHYVIVNLMPLLDRG